MLRQLARQVAQPLGWQCNPAAALAVRGVKATTGIVGVPVDPEARQHLKEKIHQVLEAVKVIPAEAYYRTAVEESFKQRLDAVNSAAADEEIEERFNVQLEQILKQCNDELSLIPKMAVWKPWEVPADHKVEYIYQEPVPS